MEAGTVAAATRGMVARAGLERLRMEAGTPDTVMSFEGPLRASGGVDSLSEEEEACTV